MGTFVIVNKRLTIRTFMSFLPNLMSTITFPFTTLTKVPTADPRTAGGTTTNMIGIQADTAGVLCGEG